MIPHIISGDTLTYVGQDGTPKQVQVNHPNYREIRLLVEAADTHPSDWEELMELLVPRVRLTNIIKKSGTSFSITDDGRLYCEIDGEPFELSDALAKHILALHHSYGDLTPLLNFVRKLADNPRKEVADELWGFITTCGLSLTPKGNFLAYKNVNSDFTSVYDGVTDNSPGTVLKMRRSSVMHDPNRTCAAGLHFAAWGYLQYYASGRKTVLVSVNPKDVVSIPTDYDNMKGRACRYKVLREVEQPEELKNRQLFDEDGADFEDDNDFDVAY